MPCYDSRDDDERKLTSAILCAIFRLVEEEGNPVSDLLDYIDLKRAGVTKEQVLSWWKDHKEIDRILKK